MSRPSESPSTIAENEIPDAVKSFETPHERLIHEFQKQLKRETNFRKYPDWRLLERILVAHGRLLDNLEEIKAEIESLIQQGDLAKAKPLLVRFVSKLDEYQKIFTAEQKSLDEVKRFQEAATQIRAKFVAERKSLPSLIEKAPDEISKKLLKTQKNRTVKFNQEMKLVVSHILQFDIYPKQAAEWMTQLLELEKNYARLSEAVTKQDMKYFEKTAAKRKKPAAKKPRVSKAFGMEESEPVKALLLNLQNTLNNIRKNFGKYEDTFKSKKSEINKMVTWRDSELNKQKMDENHFTPHHEIIARMAINKESRKWVHEMIELQAMLEKDRELAVSLTKKNEKIFLKELLNQIKLNRQGDADDSKSKEQMDLESVNAITRDEKSKVFRVLQLGAEIQAKKLIKLIHDPLVKYKKMYQHESDLVKEVRTARRELEARFDKIKAMDDFLKEDKDIKILLETIADKMNKLLDPEVNRLSIKKMVAEVEMLMGRLIKTKKSLRDLRRSGGAAKVPNELSEELTLSRSHLYNKIAGLIHADRELALHFEQLIPANLVTSFTPHDLQDKLSDIGQLARDYAKGNPRSRFELFSDNKAPSQHSKDFILLLGQIDNQSLDKAEVLDALTQHLESFEHRFVGRKP